MYLTIIVTVLSASIFQKKHEDFIYFFLPLVNQIGMCTFFIFSILSIKKTEIREQGICHGLFIYKWRQIKAYSWQENILCLQLKSHWTLIKYLKIQIFTTNKEQLDRILSQYL